MDNFIEAALRSMPDDRTVFDEYTIRSVDADNSANGCEVIRQRLKPILVSIKNRNSRLLRFELFSLDSEQRHRFMSTYHQILLATMFRYNCTDILSILISLGFSTEKEYQFVCRDQYCKVTAAWIAAQSGRLDFLRTLYENGANLNTACNICGETAFLAAIHKGQEECFDFFMQLIAEKRISVNIYEKTFFGLNAVMMACKSTSLYILVVLLRNNFKHLINEKDVKGNTALHYAAQKGVDEIVHYLLAYGAIEIRNLAGNFPTAEAAKCRHEIVSFSLSTIRPVFTINKLISTMSYYAKRRFNAQIALRFVTTFINDYSWSMSRPYKQLHQVCSDLGFCEPLNILESDLLSAEHIDLYSVVVAERFFGTLSQHCINVTLSVIYRRINAAWKIFNDDLMSTFNTTVLKLWDDAFKLLQSLITAIYEYTPNETESSVQQISELVSKGQHNFQKNVINVLTLEIIGQTIELDKVTKSFEALNCRSVTTADATVDYSTKNYLQLKAFLTFCMKFHQSAVLLPALKYTTFQRSSYSPMTTNSNGFMAESNVLITTNTESKNLLHSSVKTFTETFLKTATKLCKLMSPQRCMVAIEAICCFTYITYFLPNILHTTVNDLFALYHECYRKCNRRIPLLHIFLAKVAKLTNGQIPDLNIERLKNNVEYIIKLLLDFGVDPDALDNERRTALHIAMKHSYLYAGVIDILLRRANETDIYCCKNRRPSDILKLIFLTNQNQMLQLNKVRKLKCLAAEACGLSKGNYSHVHILGLRDFIHLHTKYEN